MRLRSISSEDASSAPPGLPRSRVTQRAASTPRLAMQMSVPSWLECRIRILLYSPSRLRTTAAAAGIPLATVALLAASQFPAPSLLASELRKLPPQDRKDVFVTGALFWKVEPLPNRSSNSALSEATPAGLVSAVDFGVPTGMGLRPGFPPDRDHRDANRSTERQGDGARTGVGSEVRRFAGGPRGLDSNRAARGTLRADRQRNSQRQGASFLRLSYFAV